MLDEIIGILCIIGIFLLICIFLPHITDKHVPLYLKIFGGVFFGLFIFVIYLYPIFISNIKTNTNLNKEVITTTSV